MDDRSQKKTLAVCATHGLRYNAELEPGCVLCRKLREPQPLPSRRIRHVPFVLALSLLVVAGVLGMRAIKRLGTAAELASQATASLPRADVELERAIAHPAPEVVKGHEPITDRLEAAAAGRDSDAKTSSMYFAAANGSGRAIKRLLAKGANIDQLDQDARNLNATPLTLAIDRGHLSLALWLIREGANVNLHRPIDLAARAGMSAVVIALLDRGADANAAPPVNVWQPPDAPIQLAVDNADVESAESLKSHGAKLDVTDTSGRTLLTRAASSKKQHAVKMVQWLIDNGASPVAPDKQLEREERLFYNSQQNGFMPVRQAALHGNAAVVRLLVLNGAAVNLTRWDGFRMQPLLAEAAMTRFLVPGSEPAQREVIHTLIELGADPRVAMSYMAACPLCNNRRPWAEEAFIRQNAAHPVPRTLYDIVDEGGNTHLHWAAALGEAALIVRLIKRDMDVDKLSNGPGKFARGYDAGATPLHLAAAYGDSKAIEALLSAGAKRDKVDTQGRLPKDVVCLLRQSDRYGIDSLGAVVDRCARAISVLGGEPAAR